MRRSYIMIVWLFLGAVSLPLAYADRGMIPATPGASVYEPGQKAIIAWNGQEEILILSTDVSSNQETMVLEILPLPSKPVVEAASFQSFEEIQSMIWQEGISRLMYSSKNDARYGSVEVLFHQQIGAHNITVVKAGDTSELIDWAKSFLEENQVNEEISLGEFESVIEDYMNRGFRHYALDLVTFSQEQRSVNPILYRFDSSFLYYPLMITSPVAGNSEITLFVLTKDKVNQDYWPMEKAFYVVNGGASQAIEFVLSKGDLSKIDLRIDGLFQDEAWLTVLRYEGELNLLTRDLMVSEDALTPPINVEVTVPITLIVLIFLLATASTLAGVAAAFLMTRPKKPSKEGI